MAERGNTREKLIDTTLHLMWEQGYSGVSVDKICKAAEVNKGSFYHFFPSKEDLVLAALDAGWAFAESGLYRVAFDPDLPALERFNRLLDLTVSYHENMRREGWNAEQGCPFGNVGAETGVDDRRILEKIRSIYEKEAAYFEAALTDAVAEGAIPPQDVAETARGLVALQSGLLQHAKIYDDTGWIARFLPTAARILGVALRDGRFAVSQPVGT